MIHSGTHICCARHWRLGCTQPTVSTTQEQAQCMLFATRRLPARTGTAQFLQLSQYKVCPRHSMAPRAAAGSAKVQALATAIKSVYTSSSKVTVVLLDATKLADADRKTRLDTVVWHFQQADFSNFEVLEKQADTLSVTIGDVADELSADLLIMSVEPVHAKSVDANLLAEFVPCPMLLLP